MGWYLLAELLDDKDQIENIDDAIAVDVGLAVFFIHLSPRWGFGVVGSLFFYTPVAPLGL